MNNKSNGRSVKPKHLFLRPDAQIITDRKGKLLVVMGCLKDIKLNTGMQSSFKKTFPQSF